MNYSVFQWAFRIPLSVTFISYFQSQGLLFLLFTLIVLTWLTYMYNFSFSLSHLWWHSIKTEIPVFLLEKLNLEMSANGRFSWRINNRTVDLLVILSGKVRSYKGFNLTRRAMKKAVHRTFWMDFYVCFNESCRCYNGCKNHILFSLWYARNKFLKGN